MNKNTPLVSVIVPTYNSVDTLDPCLSSVKSQTYPKIEIIVVDNYSIDNTIEIAKRYTDKIFSKGPERSSQKNWGAKKSEGKYLLFLDSDAEPSPEVVEECVKKCGEGFVAIIIPEEHVGDGFWAKSKTLERKCYLGDDTIEAPWFFKASTFKKIGGYDEELVAGEDWDIFERTKVNGDKTVRIEAIIKHHIGRLALREIIKKKYYYGKKLNDYIRKNPDFRNKIPLLRSAYFRNWRLLIKQPLHSIGFIILKLIECVAVGFGLIVSRFTVEMKTNER